MQNFAMLPGPTTPPVMGLIVRGRQRAPLHQKITDRRAHYGALSIAVGNDWTALISTDHEEPAVLPWLEGDPTYLYALTAGCFCQVGYCPNVPESLLGAMVAALRRDHKLDGALAITAEHPEGQLYDLTKARKLDETEMTALENTP